MWRLTNYLHNCSYFCLFSSSLELFLNVMQYLANQKRQVVLKAYLLPQHQMVKCVHFYVYFVYVLFISERRCNLDNHLLPQLLTKFEIFVVVVCSWWRWAYQTIRHYKWLEVRHNFGRTHVRRNYVLFDYYIYYYYFYWLQTTTTWNLKFPSSIYSSEDWWWSPDAPIGKYSPPQ